MSKEKICFCTVGGCGHCRPEVFERVSEFTKKTKQLIIHGDIPVKKNRQRIGAHGGIYKHQASKDYEELVAQEVMVQRFPAIQGKFAISGEFCIKPRKDLDGVLTTLLDSLQGAGVISNDNLLTEIRDLKKIECTKGMTEFVKISLLTTSE